MKYNYAMVVDTKKCLGCMACIISCETENNVPDTYSRCWIKTITTGKRPKLFMEVRSERCNHCENPPCVYYCPTGASHIKPGGIVKVKESRCVGCKACLIACPYNARFMHPEGHATKCTFCHHRVIKGLKPACVSNCPTLSMNFGNINDPSSDVAKLLKLRKHKILNPEFGTNPKLYFLL